MSYFFTSDTHFGHANILRYDKRPFTSIEEHDEELVRRWNEVVSKSDVIYHLGDVAWHTTNSSVDSLLSRLNGTKILIQGNHDSKHVLRSTHWAKVCEYYEINIEKQKICLFHYRMTVWNRSHRGAWALHGHSHGTLPRNYQAKTLDVGTMNWNYYPVSFETLKEELAKHTFVPVDSHDGDR